MAEVKNVQINVDTKSAVDAMENLSKATHDVSASFEEVYGELQPLTTRMGEAEDRLYELANAGQTATKEYQDLLNTVANYRKVQIQTDMAVDAASKTFGSKLGGVLNGVSAGFSIAQGAMGAFGVESEELEKQMLKVQSAMAIQQGVQGFREAIPDIKAFGASLKAAIGSTGIGLLVVALGAIVAYWDDIKAAVSGVSDEQSRLNAKTDANVAAQQAKYDSISGQENILRLQGKSEKDILKLKQTQIQAVIKATEAQLVQQEATKKAQVAAAKRNNDILQGMIKFLTAPLQLLLKTVDMVGSALGKDFGLQKGFNKGLANLVFDPKAVEEEGDKTIQATKDKLTALKNEAAGFQLSLNDLNKKPVEKAGKETVKAAIEMVKAFDEAALEINQIDEKYFEEMKARDAEDLARIEADNQLIVDAHAELQQDLTDAELTRIRITKEAEEEKQRKFKENLKTSLDLSIKGLNLIASIAEMNAGEDVKRQKRAFNIRKAANIASATMDGYNAVLSTFAETKGGVVLKSIAASIAGGFAALQIAGIAKTKFEGGGSTSSSGGISGGGISGGGAAQAPSFNVVGNSGMNQLAQIQQTPIQAYVVSGEVTSAQALDRNRIKNATL
jgi:hypothetical protein